MDICTIPKELFKPFFGTVFNVKPSVVLQIKSDCLHVSGLSTGNSSMINATLFVPTQFQTVVQLNLEKVIRLVHGIPTSDIKLVLEGNKIFIKDGNAKIGITLLADPNVKHFDIPEKLTQSLTTSFSLDHSVVSEIVTKVIGKLDDTSQSLVVTAENNKLIVYVKIDGEDDIEIEYETPVTGDRARTRLPHDLLSDILVMHKSFTKFNFKLATNHPLCVDMTNEHETLKITGLVSPRIEEGDE